MPITRVGLVAKTGLDAAAGVLAELAGWLEAREVRAVFETDTAALAGLPPEYAPQYVMPTAPRVPAAPPAPRRPAGPTVEIVRGTKGATYEVKKYGH